MADLDILKCPKCPDRLEAVELEHFVEDGIQYQRILWMCKGVPKRTCTYPIDMPVNVFWTKRTLEQEQEGFLPLPQIHLLPKRYHDLYPKFFATKGSFELCLIGKDNEKRKRKLETPDAAPSNSEGGSSRRHNQSPAASSVVDELSSVPLRGDTPASDCATKGSTDSSPSPVSTTDSVGASEVAAQCPCSLAPLAASASATPVTLAHSAISTSYAKDGFLLDGTALPLAPAEHSLTEGLPSTDAAACETNENVPGTSASLIGSTVGVNSTLSLKSGSDKNIPSTTCGSSSSGKHLMPVVSLASKGRESIVTKTTMTSSYGGGIALATASDSSLSKEMMTITSGQVSNEPTLSLSDTHDARDGSAFNKSTNSTSNKSAPSVETVLPQEHDEDDPNNDDSLFRVVVIDEESDEGTDNMQMGVHSHNESPLNTSNQSSSSRPSESVLHLRSHLGPDHEKQKELRPSMQLQDSSELLPKRIRSFSAFSKHIIQMPPNKSKGSPAVDSKKSASNFAQNCEEKLLKDKEMRKEMTRGSRHRAPPRKGEASPFEEWMVPRDGMFDKHDWRKPVRLACGTAIDAFVTTYNLMYNRDKFMNAVSDEMHKQNILLHDPALSLRQQRMMEKVRQSWNNKDGEEQFDRLKKSIDLNALRQQVIHGAGIAQVLRDAHTIDTENSIKDKVDEGGSYVAGPSRSSEMNKTVGDANASFRGISANACAPAPEGEMTSHVESAAVATDESCSEEMPSEKAEKNNAVKSKVREYVEKYMQERETSAQKVNVSEEDEHDEGDVEMAEERSSSASSGLMAISEEYYDGYEDFDLENDYDLFH